MKRDEWTEARAFKALAEMEASPEDTGRSHAECLAAEVLRLREKLKEQEKLALAAVRIILAAAQKKIAELTGEDDECVSEDQAPCGAVVSYTGPSSMILCWKVSGHKGPHGGIRRGDS